MSDFQSVTAVLVGVVSFITVLFYGKFLWRRSKMPPGPFPIPILGNFLQIHSDGLLPNLLKLSKAYGPVYTVHFGSRPAVIVTGYPALREVLINHGDAFLNRGTLPAADRVMHHEEQPFEPSTLLICASSNVLANMLMETRYDYNDEKWMKILQGTREAFHIMSSFWGQLYDFFPAVMEWLPGPHKRIFFLLEILEDVMKESIRNHQQTLDPACPRDFIDCYLIKMTQENNNLGKSPFTLKGLPPAIMDMFLGGTESTALTLNFGFLILMKYPELQDKMYDEIDQVVGQAREPRAENRTQMPLMNAFVHEIQRYSDVFPMGLTRSTTRDITFHGYYIPEGTDIITLLTTALRDPTQFETPEKFNIKHFLDDNGKFRKRNAFLPFSAGKRACIAESLVRMQLFLTFTIILQKFTLKSMMDPKDVDISPAISGVENIPPACKIIFSQRTLDGEV
ncbi:cytochrome P450 2C31-like isoform X2 [Rana temporaria]|uniref:cytochrome P450 2C31-like isoform X2 n=1 Tax=Rana temporaria TaxID=8407 RepID=UPI001AAC6B75|nr:cytochrome P450 2C31-like isoform X2 [Rana temporaria]